jgi:hypothetical protein
MRIAVACRDWKWARKIVQRIDSALEELRGNALVEPIEDADRQWQAYRQHLKRSLSEALLCSYPLNSRNKAAAAAERLVAEINQLSPDALDFFADSCASRSRDLFWSDLGRIPFKDLLLDKSNKPNTNRSFDVSTLPQERQGKAQTISRFLDEIGESLSTLAPLLFPTRPLNAPEVTELCPRAVWDLALLCEFVQALRGTWVTTQPKEQVSAKDKKVITIGKPWNR